VETPKYRLDFEVDAYLAIDGNIETKLSDGSRIILQKSTDTNKGSKGSNKGSIVFRMDTLDFRLARREGILKTTAFLNFLLVVSNMDNTGQIKFADSPELLNAEEFRGISKTNEKSFSGNALITAPFRKQWTECVNSLISKNSQLEKDKQNVIYDCLFWLRKAAESPLNERFIYRWVALEALGGILDEQFDSTPKMLNSTINTIKTESARAIFEKHRKSISQFVDASLKSRRGRNRSAELEQAIAGLERKDADYKAVMVKTALCIYEVRNKFFHKGEVLPLVDSCNTLLRELIHSIVIDLLRNVQN
jgi:hypothetical protein